MGYLIVSDRQSSEYTKLKVDSEKVDEFIKARETLVKVSDLEAIYDQIVESHWDYKNKVNYWNLRSISKPRGDYILNHEIRSSLNRLAFNLLNLGKLYLDMHYHDKKKRYFAADLTSDETLKEKITKHRKGIYNSNLEYVVGCQLRAYSQHSALPVSTFTSSIKSQQSGKEASVNFAIIYSYEDLVKIKTPKERIEIDTKLDLTKIIDGYVYAISQMHALNRELTKSIVDESKNLVLDMWSNEIDSVGYKKCSCKIEVDDSLTIHLNLDWFSVYEYLKKKHRFPVNYANIKLES